MDQYFIKIKRRTSLPEVSVFTDPEYFQYYVETNWVRGEFIGPKTQDRLCVKGVYSISLHILISTKKCTFIPTDFFLHSVRKVRDFVSKITLMKSDSTHYVFLHRSQGTKIFPSDGQGYSEDVVKY